MRTNDMKITYSVAASVDGFIAREDGDVSWLDKMDIDPEATGWADFFSTVGGLVMGRKTYDFVFHYGSWPYADKPSWVCTHRPIKALEGANLFVVNDVETVVREAVKHEVDHLWLVGGGQLASTFLSRGLITHLSIAEMPIQLGRGIPLFSDHDLSEIDVAKRNVSVKRGFKQVEFTLR